MAASDNLSPQQFYHGTTRDLTEVAPATQHGRGVVFPHDTDVDHAYATSDVGDAWRYAEKAWHATDTGYPRVYRVEPTGPYEQDPQEFSDGRLRGNYPSDVRSRHPWSVVSEEQMPEHMGTPEEWK